uniref:Uncharacterized protein n=1 Tax=Amphora coffeiformis TaxID=265554 RepID=A0A7S3L881_9STRA
MKRQTSEKSDESRNEERPEFRFVQMRTEGRDAMMQTEPGPKAPPAAAGASNEIIDKSVYAVGAAPRAPEGKPPRSNFLPKNLRPVPAFYPLEKSTRLVEDEEASEIAERISESLRSLSIQAMYDNETATASLITVENVEMHLALWKAPATSQQEGILVELQRRKGDSIVFHRYSRSILDAAVGDVDVSNLPYDMQDAMYSKKAQRLLSMELKNEEKAEHENAVIAIEIAHGLLMKDRMDARQLGLESLCLLTDARKTGQVTAMLASHAVLLGSTRGVEIAGVEADDDMMLDEGPFQEIREAILSLVQFSRIGEDEVDETDIVMSPDSEQMTLLHNLALAVLANALDNVENPERFDDNVPEDSKPRSRLRTASSTDVANDFLQQTEDVTNKDVLKTLISELGKAQQKPHNAALSAKCLGSLCRASDEARKRAKELGAKNVVSTALDVGVRTHLKLETACKTVVKVLERPDQD